jgi:copper chaperone CopZ
MPNPTRPTLPISGTTCANCAAAVEHSLKEAKKGVKQGLLKASLGDLAAEVLPADKATQGASR